LFVRIHQLVQRLATKGWEFEPRWDQEFSLLFITQTYSEVHPTCYLKSTGALSRRLKRQEREDHHSPPTGAEVKKTMYLSTKPFHYSIMA
jgi:hypothetical protein